MADPSLQEQAYLEATGLVSTTAPSTNPELGGVTFTEPPPEKVVLGQQGMFDPGRVDSYQLLAYYPPTRETRDLSPYVESITYTESVGQAGVNGSIQFLDLSRPGALLDWKQRNSLRSFIALNGLVLIFSTARVGYPFVERQRWINWEPRVGGVGSDTITVYDNLVYIANGQCSAGYSNKTASDITADLCRRFNVPVRSIVKATYQIPYFLFTGSIYDAISQAYAFERHFTGNYFYITSDRGQLVVRRARSVLHDPHITFLLDPATNVRDPLTFSRSMDQYAAGIIPTGTDAAGNAADIVAGTIDPNSGVMPNLSPADLKAVGLSQADIASSSGVGKAITGKRANERLAASALFGGLVVNQRLHSVRDPHYSKKAAEYLSNRLARAQKRLEAMVDGNVLLRQGDRVHVLGYPLDLYISSITQTISRADHTMQIDMAWREFEVSDMADYHAVQQAGAQYAQQLNQSSGTPGVSGTVPAGGKYANARDWAKALLTGLGDPVTTANVNSIYNWWGHEGGAGPQWGTNNLASYNPLNTSQVPASGPYGNTGSQGNIKVYSSWQQGLEATIATLQNGSYSDILARLRAGAGLQTGASNGLLKWSSNGYSSV